MPSKVILIEASPRRANDGVAETVRLAGGGGQFPYHYGGNHWRAGVVQLPTIITAISFDGGDFGTGGVPQAAELQWAASRKADLAAIANYFWIDAPISVRIGDENAAGNLPAVAITGKVLNATVEGGVVKLQLSDPAADLKKPLLTARFGGTGGADGPAEWDGRIKTRIWGRVWNLEGERIDPANNVYCFADPARPIQSFDALRDKGAPAAAINVLAWQGSVAATFTALQAAVAPQGGGVACPSIACVKWWTQPAGALTADLKGEVGAGYVETTAQIVERIVQAGPSTPFAAGTIAAAQGWRSAPVGWIARDDSTGTASMIEELLGNVSLLWLLNASGEIVIREWTWGASVASAVSQSVKRTATFAPVGTRKIGYKRNETQMARGDFAAIVLAENVAFADGTEIGQAISDAYALASARGKVWMTPVIPGAAESNIGDTWISPDGVFHDRVNDGGILLGGFAITLGGFRPQLAWTISANQPVVAAAKSATWTGISGAGKPEDNADVTSLITGVSNITIEADYTGAVTSALPRTSSFRLIRNGIDVTTSSVWSVEVMSGVVSASIGSANGVLSINTSDGLLLNSVVRITAINAGRTRTFDVAVFKNLAPAPSTGGTGGSSSFSSFFGTTTIATMVAISPELSITIGASGQAALAANYDFNVSNNGSFDTFARWYRWNGSAYVAIGSEVQSNVPASYVAADLSGATGSGSCNFTDTGLTASSVQKYRLFMRNSSGTVSRAISGNVAAVGS